VAFGDDLALVGNMALSFGDVLAGLALQLQYHVALCEQRAMASGRSGVPARTGLAAGPREATGGLLTRSVMPCDMRSA
jgi:hypothetical protein